MKAETININKTRKALAYAYNVSINESIETPIGQMLAYRKAA